MSFVYLDAQHANIGDISTNITENNTQQAYNIVTTVNIVNPDTTPSKLNRNDDLFFVQAPRRLGIHIEVPTVVETYAPATTDNLAAISPSNNVTFDYVLGGVLINGYTSGAAGNQVITIPNGFGLTLVNGLNLQNINQGFNLTVINKLPNRVITWSNIPANTGIIFETAQPGNGSYNMIWVCTSITLNTWSVYLT